MAKDAGGHGSEARGGIARTEAILERMNRAADRAGVTPRQGFGNTAIQSPANQDNAAAAALASGPKSAPVATHPAMNSQGTVRTPSGHNYNAGAVNAAIASSNRSGRRIGGREASLIHRLLRG
jgi:hypothetical protein